MPRAVVQARPGGPESVQIDDVPSPEPGPGEVVLRVRAAAINPFDAKVMSARIPVPDLAFPRGVGTDVAGVVVAAGPEARHPDGVPMSPGDEVLGWADGSLREEVVVATSNLIRRPPVVSWEVAGGLETAGLAAVAEMDILQPGADDTVLVSAAAGGVGLIGCQLAAARGASVVGTASPRHHQFLRELGVVPLAYGEGLAERLRDLGTRITAVADNAGRPAIEAALARGIPRSRIVTVVDHAAVTELEIGGVGRYERTAANLARLVQSVADGTITVPVASTFGLADVQDAFAELAGPHAPGKIVVTM